MKQKIMVVDNDLPDIMKFIDNNKEEYFVRRDRLLTLCSYILNNLRSKIKADITSRWTKILASYYREKSMENDTDFEEFLKKLVRLYSPVLLIILNDKRTALQQYEAISRSIDPSKVEKFFDNNSLIPFRKLFGLKREKLLLYSKLSLPFWYSIPVIVSIAAFFKHKIKKVPIYYKEAENSQENYLKPSLKVAAEKLIKEIVPGNFTVDEYMESLIDRWNQILNRSAQEKLTRDVNLMIKDYMRNAIKTFGYQALNSSMLDELAERMIRSNTALSRINNKNALRIYIKTYITKILLD
jgi:hypothetical protein